MRRMWFHGALAVGGATLFAGKLYFNGGVCTAAPDLRGRTAIVSGANTGLGKETAHRLAELGATVIMACRDKVKGEETRQHILKSLGTPSDLHVWELDLANLESVDRFLERWNTQQAGLGGGPKLDLLIANAGIMALPQRETTTDGFERQLGVNHLGHMHLTLGLLPSVQRAAEQTGDARIVVVSSLAHEKGSIQWDDLQLSSSPEAYTAWGAYRQSKLANVMFANALNRRLKGTGAIAVSLHPGVVRTELGRHMDFPRWKMMLLSPALLFCLKTPWQGAQTTLHCAMADGVEGGMYYSDCEPKEMKGLPEGVATDEAMQERLWTQSLEAIAKARQRNRVSSA
mmetsp:Transcript_76103/g.126836  ORF Transcript_76103/g.126836 Transcript_76103/m.126836 type:complete len:343 (-) Transcript_76103:90-1118(-)